MDRVTQSTLVSFLYMVDLLLWQVINPPENPQEKCISVHYKNIQPIYFQ